MPLATPIAYIQREQSRVVCLFYALTSHRHFTFPPRPATAATRRQIGPNCARVKIKVWYMVRDEHDGSERAVGVEYYVVISVSLQCLLSAIQQAYIR